MSLLLAGLTCAQECLAQQDIVLIRKNTIVSRIREGEYIRFKRKDRDQFNTGHINGIYVDYFRIGDDTTYLYQVESIDMTGRPNTGFKMAPMGSAFIIAGAALFLGDLITVTAVQGNDYTFNRGVVIVSTALVGTGVLMQFVNNKYYKTGRKKKIITMSR